MKLERIRIENFRSFSDETIDFNAYTCLVGPNGAGKSTILTALNVFFRNTTSTSTNVVSLCKEDFHHENTDIPIKITLTFKDLSAEAQADLKHYFRQGRLVVSATAAWNGATNTAEVRQYGQRTVMKLFMPYFKAVEQKAKAQQLKELYDELRKSVPDLSNATTGPARESALREYEEAHPELCEPVDSETEFFGFTKGANLLQKYIQWVYVPAVKDASTEQQEGNKGALKDLLDRTVRSKVSFKEPIAALRQQAATVYQQLLEQESGVLSELQTSLHGRLKSWSNPGCELRLNWHYDEAKSVVVNEPSVRASIGEDKFLGEVARLGHGLQRSFLISLLHELASLNAEDGPTLLLGFEEPELYQHPPQAQHIADVLEQLATAGKTNTQVIVSTHSPYFVSSKGFENVRLVRKHYEDKCSLVAATTFEKIEAIVAAATGDRPDPPTATMAAMEMIMQPSQRELFFTRVAVLVEGLEDVGYIASHLVVHKQWNDFRRLGCHFVITGGKTSMSRPLAIARELCIKAYAVIDGDTNKTKQDELDRQRKDNLAILRICGLAAADPMPAEPFITKNCTIWSSTITHTLRDEAGNKLWSEAEQSVRKKHGFQEGVGLKNKLFVAAIIEELCARKFSSTFLNELCCSILAYADESKPAITGTVVDSSEAKTKELAAESA